MFFHFSAHINSVQCTILNNFVCVPIKSFSTTPWMTLVKYVTVKENYICTNYLETVIKRSSV